MTSCNISRSKVSSTTIFFNRLFSSSRRLSRLISVGSKVEARGARDLSEVPAGDLPHEIAPLAATLSGLLSRLRDALEAERSFAANTAHELRTPLAGAIAQAQRLKAETSDPATEARAEGGQLRMDHRTDLREVARLVVANEGPVLPRETLNRRTAWFERAHASADGSGLGLAIVAAIANRIESPLCLKSPRPGAASGFQASIVLPTEAPDSEPHMTSAP
jgi:signal transduction histidine kinase